MLFSALGTDFQGAARTAGGLDVHEFADQGSGFAHAAQDAEAFGFKQRLHAGEEFEFRNMPDLAVKMRGLAAGDPDGSEWAAGLRGAEHIDYGHSDAGGVHDQAATAGELWIAREFHDAGDDDGVWRA